MPVASLFPAEEGLPTRLRAAAEAGAGIRVSGRRHTRVPFTVDLEASRLGDGTLLCLLREVRDERLLTESRAYLDAAFERSPIGMALFNTDGEYVRVNAALARMLGRAEPALIGRRDQELTHPADRQADVDAAWRILAGELDVWQTEKRFVAADGSVVWAIANLAFVRDADGRPLCWFGQFQDITERKRLEQRLTLLAEEDELTGVLNRRGLLRALDAQIAHIDAGAHGSLLLLDLDGFKAVNDRRGHEAGDVLLATIAMALRATLDESDVIGRLGGDEFAAILPGTGEAGARLAAEAVAERIREVSRDEVTASCGTASYGSDRPRTARDLLEEADRGMYEAKAARRDRRGARAAVAQEALRAT
jgi:diguanylate cyclase (GGDEF)-like protein/PAS domain S-box-containing protein